MVYGFLDLKNIQIDTNIILIGVPWAGFHWQKRVLVEAILNVAKRAENARSASQLVGLIIWPEGRSKFA